MAGLVAIKCDIDDAPWVYEQMQAEGFIRERSFVVLVFLGRKPNTKAPSRADD